MSAMFRPLRVVRARPRLFAALLVGVVTALVLAVATGWRPATRMLVAWDVFLGLYLVLVTHLMASSTIEHIRQRADVEDEGQVTILVLTVAAALASLAAIFAELGAQNGRRPLHMALAGATLAHRLGLRPEAELEGVAVSQVLQSAVDSVPVPR